MSPAKLYLVPSPLGEGDPSVVLPEGVLRLLRSLDTFVVENERTARRFLSKVGMEKPIRELSLFPLNEHTAPAQLPTLLKPLLEGKDMGLLSEAGVPCVVDPGASLVRLAHEKGIQVVPLVGPSSLLLALMASGLNGQSFAFMGYLPKGQAERIRKLQALERAARERGETQIFIETPYRNQHVLDDILAHGKPDTRLCLATDLTLPTESIRTWALAQWKKGPPNLDGRPTVFLIGK